MTRPKIAILGDWNGFARESVHLQRLESVADVTVYGDRPPTAELVERLRDVDGVILWRERIRLDADVLGAADKLVVIGQTGYTWPHIDLDALKRRGITLTASSYTDGAPVAEYTLGLILDLAHRISFCDRHMRAEPWPAVAALNVRGKTLGVVGYGRIGQELARMATALRMDVLTWSRSLTPGQEVAPGVRAASLDEVLRSSRFVSIHLPLNDCTRGMLSREKLSLMRSDAFLVNTSRGPIVDEGALADLVATNRIAGAALDVYGEEPLPMDHPLRRTENVVLCPHIGWTNDEVQGSIFKDTVDDVIAFFEGHPRNVVSVK